MSKVSLHRRMRIYSELYDLFSLTGDFERVRLYLLSLKCKPVPTQETLSQYLQDDRRILPAEYQRIALRLAGNIETLRNGMPVNEAPDTGDGAEDAYVKILQLRKSDEVKPGEMLVLTGDFAGYVVPPIGWLTLRHVMRMQNRRTGKDIQKYREIPGLVLSGSLEYKGGSATFFIHGKLHECLPDAVRKYNRDLLKSRVSRTCHKKLLCNNCALGILTTTSFSSSCINACNPKGVENGRGENGSTGAPGMA